MLGPTGPTSLRSDRVVGHTASARATALEVSTLYYGDNLDNLRKLKDATIDLCYIDPPFNSKRSYNQIYNNVGNEDRAQAQAFVDTWTWNEEAIKGRDAILLNADGRFHGKTIELIKGLRSVLDEGSLLAYLVSLTLRIVEIRRVLKSTGSFYLHCDPTASHYLKLVCDSVFCAQGGDFQNEIIWKRTGAHGSSHRWGPVHDVILFYAKDQSPTWTDPRDPPDLDYIARKFTECDPGSSRMFQGITLTGSGIRHGESGQSWRGISPTSSGRHWALPGDVIEALGITADGVHQKLDALDAAGVIKWPSKTDGRPRLKWYADQLKGTAMPDLWTEPAPLNSQAAERLGYSTQKPEALLRRIIEASSKPGDVVLDAYCGCGTTVAVAQASGREWIGMDITYQSISLILRRLEDHFGEKAIEAVKIDGAPRDMASAVALAHKKDDRVRKEFEKWAVLTYSNNRATINEKKGADKGIDGTAYFMATASETAKMVFQVKSGGVKRGDIATFNHDRTREGAAMATLITLEPPTGPMANEALGCGLYRHQLMGRDYPVIQIVTVQQIIEAKKRLDLPMGLTVIKKAPAGIVPGQPKEQLGLLHTGPAPTIKPKRRR